MEILNIINQLIELGAEGQQALNTLEQIPEWNQLVQQAADSTLEDL